MSIGQIRVLGNKRTVLRTGILFISLFVVLLSWGHASADTISTYDDFSSGSIQGSKWVTKDLNNFFSIPNSPPYVLQASGTGTNTGDNAFPASKLTTVSSFSGHFGTAITFFDFSYTGSYFPQPSDPRPPSLSLVIGDWDSNGHASNNLFVVSRIFGGPPELPDHNLWGWRELNPDGTDLTNPVKGIGLNQNLEPIIAPSSGALEMDYDPVKHELNVGFFLSTDPNTWNDLSPVKIATFTDVYFNGDPRLMISFSPGGGGTLSTDIGGLYYADIVDHNPNPVPLPPSVLLLAPGLLGLAAIRRRHKK